jgi:hypothetical protein
MPLPPPPKAAFTSNGYPTRGASFFAASMSTGSRVPGTIGMPAGVGDPPCCRLVAHLLDRVRGRAHERGSGSSTACAKCARSARNP